jgi:16S rRNA (cytosine967-C5)-methyltransferase
MYAHSYLNTSATIIGGYTGNEPLSAHLRHFFSKNRKHGSRDRKAISHLCYCFFRLGNAFSKLPLEARIVQALYLCSKEPNGLLETLNPELNRSVTIPTKEKMMLSGDAFLWQQVFPLPGFLSPKIDAATFATAHLVQPDLFLRIRPGYENEVRQLAEALPVPYQFLSPVILQLPNSADVASFFTLNKQVVVQDHSSQQTGELFRKYIPEIFPDHKNIPLQILDACAASGGKTILLYDILEGNANFTVNDTRVSILANLKKRFKEAGIEKYDCVSANLATENVLEQQERLFDVVIADVPCSGSGTWSRCPENLSFFKEKELQTFSQLQQKITSRLVNLLKPGGLLFYITCSVYAAENEMVASFLQQNGFTLLHEQYFTGYLLKADTMYGAVLKKSE